MDGVITFDRSILDSAALACQQAKVMRDTVRDARLARAAHQPSSRVQGLVTALSDANRKIANLEIALSTSRHIGIAMGVLMTRHNFTEDMAFEALRAVSQRTHRKLREVAEQVVLSGDLVV